MTTGDEQQWAPPGDDSPSGNGEAAVGRPAIPADRNPWAPPAPEPIRRPPVAQAVPAHTGPEPVEVERVEVGAVEATADRRRGAVGRIVAAGVAALMVGGGAYLVVSAASAESGAESPEAAFEAAMAAVEAEDVVALAEIMEPSERDTVFEAGFDFVDELVRLEVLDPGVDLSSIEGIDLEFEGFEPRVERPGNGLAHVFVGAGTVSGSIDVAALPLGSLLVDRMTPEQLTFTSSGQDVIEQGTSPLVAVERDGRWYLSLWYTVAENVRLEVGAGLPDLARRPATIGGASPEAAVRQLLDDAIQLDLRRVIGSLDPEEMAVLYDYAPLFLDDADRAANELLTAAADAGWSWEIVDLGLSSEIDGELATVRLETMHVRADAANGGVLDLQVGRDRFSFELTMIDEFFGREFSMTVDFDGECAVMAVDDGSGTTTEQLCDGELGAAGGLAGFGDQLDAIGAVTRQVDGVWYVSPMRTGLGAIVAAIEQVEPETLQALVDGVVDFGLTGGFAGGLPVPGLDPGLVFPGGTDTEAFTAVPDPLDDVEHLDLLADALDPSFAWGLDASDAEREIGHWVLGIDVVAERGLYATVPAAGGGEIAIVIIELADADGAAGSFATYAAQNQLAVVDGPGGAQTLETVDWVDDPLLLHLDGDQLVLVGVYGASVEDARLVLGLQAAS